MPIIAPNAVVLCEQAATVEYRKDLRLFVVASGDGIRAYTADAFMQTIASCVDCARQHRPWEQTAQIVSLADHQAATGKSSK
jgi:hypothetical protein